VREIRRLSARRLETGLRGIVRHFQRNGKSTDRPHLRNTAPVLDPTNWRPGKNPVAAGAGSNLPRLLARG
jgi:hypothetical protein